MKGYCTDEDCLEEAFRDGLCYGHLKRKQRDKTVSGVLRRAPKSGWERLTEASLRYADAPEAEDDEYDRAADSLRKSAVAYTLGLEQFRRLAALTGLKLGGHHAGRRVRKRVSRWIQLELITLENANE